MWKEYISKYIVDAKFASPANIDDIKRVENDLNVKFTAELNSFLLETDGSKDRFNSDLIWSLERIRNDNLYFRGSEDFKDLYMPFDHLLFFADSGTGDQFAYAIINGKIIRNDIFVWDHETDTRKSVASSMKQYIELWLTDKIQY